MSFGIGVGDFITIAGLSWKLYDSCSKSPAEFSELQNDCLSVHIAANRIESNLKSGILCLDRNETKQLDTLISHCQKTLDRLHELMLRYNSLSTLRKAIWERIRFGTEDLADIRHKLTLHLTALHVYANTVQLTALERIERRLSILAFSAQSGEMPSLPTSNPVAMESSLWHELVAELQEEGFGQDDIEHHRERIKAQIRKVLFDLEDIGDTIWPEESISAHNSRPPSVIDTAIASVSFGRSVGDILFPNPKREAWHVDPQEIVLNQGADSLPHFLRASRTSILPDVGRNSSQNQYSHFSHNIGDKSSNVEPGRKDAGCQTDIPLANSAQPRSSTSDSCSGNEPLGVLEQSEISNAAVSAKQERNPVTPPSRPLGLYEFASPLQQLSFAQQTKCWSSCRTAASTFDSPVPTNSPSHTKFTRTIPATPERQASTRSSSPQTSPVTPSPITTSALNPSFPPMRSYRVDMDAPCHKVLPMALAKYRIDDDWRLYSLYIVLGDKERCLGLDEKPLIIFKQLTAEGAKPLFMLRRHASPLDGFTQTRNAASDSKLADYRKVANEHNASAGVSDKGIVKEEPGTNWL